VGDSSLLYVTGGTGQNTAIGSKALQITNTGAQNTAVGYHAGITNTTGSQNTYLGNIAGTTSGAALTNYTAVGYNAGNSGTPASNWIDLGNTSVSEIRAQVTAITAYSDARIKDNVQENVPGLAFITRLRPVTYNLNIHRQHDITFDGQPDNTDWEGKYDIEKITQSGFIAQEVEKAANEVGYDFNGLHKPSGPHDLYGLGYTNFVMPLVKAVQEQQQMIEQQQKTITEQQKSVTDQQAINAKLLQRMDEMQKEIEALREKK